MRVSSSQDTEPLPALSPEQQRVVDLVVSGKSVFFTGCAGAAQQLFQNIDAHELPLSHCRQLVYQIGPEARF